MIGGWIYWLVFALVVLPPALLYVAFRWRRRPRVAPVPSSSAGERLQQMVRALVDPERRRPGELEAAIGGLPEVVDVAVFGVADEEFGQRLVACVVLQPGASLEPDQLIERVRPLVSRQALPREVRVVDALPRNATGKVLVAELRATYVGDTHPPD